MSSPAVWLLAEARSTFRALRLPPDAIEGLARRRLREVLVAAAGTELGRRRLQAAGVAPSSAPERRDPFDLLCALAPVGKPELRSAGAGALLGGRVDPAWRSSHSSGSTGEPFRVYYDARAWAILKHLVKLRARAACGLRPWHRVALLDAMPPAEEGGTALEWAGRVRRISVLQPADRIAVRLAAFAPDAVYGLPSALVEAARVLAQRGASVAPRWIFTSGELLDPMARRALAEGYGARVHDVYGTSETKEIAWECEAGGLHLNADVVHVEILAAGGEPASAGEEGEIIVTLLVNTAMPLVRYRTGDRGSLTVGRCPCGLRLPRLGVVTGREVDALVLDGGRRVSHYALTCALERIGSLVRYQVVQLDGRSLGVRVLVGAGADRDAAEAGVRAALADAIPGPLEVKVEFVNRFEAGRNHKFRVVQPLRAAAGAAVESPPTGEES